MELASSNSMKIIGWTIASLLLVSCTRDNPCQCPQVDDPVCGSDQHSYPSACGAQCAGVGFTAGACGLDASLDCASCSNVSDPVCGSDGMTYTNACRASCAGIAIAHGGACVQNQSGGCETQ